MPARQQRSLPNVREVPGRRGQHPLRAAICLLSAVLAVLPAPATAALDLLEQPARPSGKSAKSLLLAVARAGERLVAAGERGTMVLSDDQGANWTQASVPVSVTLTTLCFVSPERGWAAGHDGVILRTTDAGKTWHKQFDGKRANALVLADLQERLAQAQTVLNSSPQALRAAATTALEGVQNTLEDAKASSSFGPSMPLLGLWFRDANEGFAVGAFGQLFHTGDGGQGWESWGARIANPQGLHYNRIEQLANGDLLISGEAGKLRRSRDAGAHWETLDTGYLGHLYGGLALAHSRTLLTFGFAGRIFRSSDDGHSWTALPPLTHKPLVAGLVRADGTIVLVTGDGRQLLSRDQGQSFVLSTTPAGRPVAAVLAPTPPSRALLLVGLGGTRKLTLDPSTD